MGAIAAACELLLALQLTQASVTGRVVDKATSEPVAGALVQLIESARHAVTDVHGRYTFQNVTPGPQHLKVSSLGYLERSVHALLPRVGILEINVALTSHPLPISAVEVRPPPQVRGSDERTGLRAFDRHVSMAALRNHPNTAEPDALLALSGGQVLVRPESPSGMHVRGGASDQLAYLIDGVPVFSPYHTAGLFSAWNPDALAVIELSSTPSVAEPHALSGSVHAALRQPGARASVTGALSTTQARVTLDGPLGKTGTAYLFSMRTGFPDAFAPTDERSYLHGESSDLLAKLVTTGKRGTLSLLAYSSENEIQASASADETIADATRNGFNWQSESFGLEFLSNSKSPRIEMRGWIARGAASALWSPGMMTWGRRDIGGVAQVAGKRGRVGMRIEQSMSSYETEKGGLAAEVPLATAFIEREISLPARVTAQAGVALAYGARALHASPRAQLHWQVTPNIEMLTSFARLHQFSQSLRNHESLASNIFPVDLFMGAGKHGVPVATSNSGVLGVAYRPFAGTRLQLQAFARSFDRLLLTAPRSPQPYAENTFASGGGRVDGIAADISVSAAAFGMTASYGWQRVRVEHHDSAYVPEYGAVHNFEIGLIAFPGATWSVRLALTGAAGRRTSNVLGNLEWESCNLLDQGCEFAGTPQHDVTGIAAASLPLYARVDAGVRKHWHVHAAGRDVQVGLFGTLTNVFGRANLLTYTYDAAGTRVPIEMRPRSLLLAGIDWRM